MIRNLFLSRPIFFNVQHFKFLYSHDKQFCHVQSKRVNILCIILHYPVLDFWRKRREKSCNFFVWSTVVSCKTQKIITDLRIITGDYGDARKVISSRQCVMLIRDQSRVQITFSMCWPISLNLCAAASHASFQFYFFPMDILYLDTSWFFLQ